MAKHHPTTEPGYVNRNGQRNDGPTGEAGIDHNQMLYQMVCTNCTTAYKANGSDIHLRKCPGCQGGRPCSEPGKI